MNEFSKYSLPEKRPTTGDDPLISFLQVNQKMSVEISVKNVRRLDSLRLRTLLSAQKHWHENNLSFLICEMSEEFRSGLTLLGVPQNQFDFEKI